VRVAIDATYSVGAELSGIGIYSRELLRDLPALFPDDEFTACLRPKQWRRRSPSHLPNMHTRMLQWPLPLGGQQIFHALNQRLDWRPAPYTVTTFHDLFVMTAEYSTPEFRARFTRQAREAAARTDFVIAVSQCTANQVHELLGVERSRIRVIYHGVHQFTLDLPEKREPVILFVGALQSRKNIIRLVEAFERTEPRWRLVLAGNGSGYGAAAIHERIDRSPRREQIEVTGYVDDRRLRQLYRSASIFAFPSLDEGFGIPILEAMHHGIPVVTSKRSATAEIAGDAALLADPENIDELACALRVLADDESVRGKLIDSGRERSRQFPWSRAIRETHAVYRELVQS
jgi:glycosyltransferase involved in cell wall biosynthesis